jgi:hypothetical protein
MPITLPQLSRRAFLRQAALAGAAVVADPQGFAGWFGKSRDSHTYAFFSDTHIAADAARRHEGVNMADNLAACVRELSAWPVKPAAIIVNGDLAFNAGLAADYETFGKLMLPVRSLATVHLSLGNHDERDCFWQAFPADATRVASVPHKQVSVIASERANWFLLDSLEFTSRTYGELGAAQLDWLARELESRPEKPAIIVGHHPLDPTRIFGLRDSPAFEQLLARHTQVKAFIYGHTHDWHVSQLECGVHLINLPQTAYPFQIGRPSGWVRATLARDGAEFELRCLDPRHPEHAKIKQLEWRSA